MTTSRQDAQVSTMSYNDKIYLPKNHEELKALIIRAKENNLHVRTIGAGHSPVSAIYDQENKKQIIINLDGEFRKIKSFNIHEAQEHAVVKVGAGCNLGVNPTDNRSTLENSFNFQVDQKGFALPTLGGISHQTIAGFLQTSSSGGTWMHNITDVIEEIEFIDGCGEYHTVNPSDDLFNAVGVSMGLFGIITSVTFKLGKKYLVQGKEENKEFADSLLAPDEKGHRTVLRDALINNEYMHINWLPHRNVKRTMQWTAHKVKDGEPPNIKPYQHTLNSKFMTTLAAATLLVTSAMYKMNSKYLDAVIGEMLKPFVNINDQQEFCDVWYTTLPIDDQTDVDHTMKLLFSELWFPEDQIDNVLNILEQLFEKNHHAAGNFILELYGAKASPFWMSPSFGDKNTLRIDLYWWDHNLGKAEEYFVIFWQELLKIEGLRFHWGKYLPIPGVVYSQDCNGKDIIFSQDTLFRNYPKFDKWKELRDQFDPDQLFLTEYWSKVLDIPFKLRKVETQQNVNSEKHTVKGLVSNQDSYLTSTLKYFGFYKDANKLNQSKKHNVAIIKNNTP